MADRRRRARDNGWLRSCLRGRASSARRGRRCGARAPRRDPDSVGARTRGRGNAAARGMKVDRRDLVALVVALVLVVPSVLIAHDGKVGSAERKVFRAINGLPEAFKPVMTAMQFIGVLIVPVIVALVVAAVWRRWRLAGALVLVVVLKLLVEKEVLKKLVERQRPGTTELPDVVLRGNVPAHGNSFPSGHAIIAFAIAWLLFMHLPRVWRWVPIAIGVLVCIARVYLGAHNPLDVVAGAGAGLFIGALLDIVVVGGGRDARSTLPDAADVRSTP